MAGPPSNLQEKLQAVLRIWLTIATNVRMRDRMVKVMQYGCQMLVGFYGSLMDNNTISTLNLCRRTASTSRKMFWILKSFNHIHDVISIWPNLQMKGQLSFINLFGLTEQLFLIAYYALENVVLLSRLRLISVDESELDPLVCWTWFGGDLACVAAIVARLHSDRNYKLSFSKELLNDLIDLSIAILELVISWDYVEGWKHVTGSKLGDGITGLLGVVASTITLIQGCHKASLTYDKC